MDQSSTPVSMESKKGHDAPPGHPPHHEQHVSFQTLPDRHYEQKAPVSSKGEDYEEEEDVDEEEDEQAFEQRLLEAQQRNQQEHSNVVSASSTQHRHPPPGSPPDSMDSNDFVKLEKPHDLFSTPPHPEVEVHLLNRDEEITPSDDVAQPIGEDLR